MSQQVLIKNNFICIVVQYMYILQYIIHEYTFVFML